MTTALHHIANPAGNPFRDLTSFVVFVVAVLVAAFAYWWFERRN